MTDFIIDDDDITPDNLIEAAADGAPPTPPPVPPADVAARRDRPKGLPNKFWDAEKGEIRVGSLWRSYQALENRYHAGDVGYPETPEGYCLDCGGIPTDPEVDALLHRARFSNDQAQLVYDLARKYVLPRLEDAERRRDAAVVQGRLEESFGGPERWQRVARQLSDWGKAHLPPDVMDALSGTFEGVMSLYRMMAADEPGVARTGAPDTGVDEKGLRALMQDPRYWREQDPALVAKVRQGFEQLYPG